MRPGLSILVLPSLVLAGCLGGGKPADGEETAAEGSLWGTVLTDELSPLGSVEVRIHEANLSSQSDPQGIFFFERVPPGRWMVHARIEGYADGYSNATVQPGAASRISLLLSEVPTQKAYQTPFRYAGTFGCTTTPGDCWALASDYGVYIPGYAAELHTFPVPVEAGVTGVHVELRWTPQTALVDRLVLEGYPGEFLDRSGARVFQAVGPSPLTYALTKADIDQWKLVEKGRLTLYVGLASESPTEPEVAIEQEFELDGTLDYWS